MTPRTVMMMMVVGLHHQKNEKEKQETPETPQEESVGQKTGEPEPRLGPEDVLVFPGSTSDPLIV